MVNISNHPSTKWGDRQLDAAKEWCCGKVIDIPFPLVPPTFTPEEVEALAKTLADKVTTLGCSTVHVMGESGLVFALVSLFYPAGIQAIHSTTERKVVEKTEEDGTVTKTAVFEFVKFRAYW